MSFNHNTRHIKFYSRLIIVILVTLSMLISSIPSISAQTAGEEEPIRNKDTNTAYIAEKSAQWTDYDNFLAQLTLAVNGTQSNKPLDVIICLDRSGSMDMNYIHELSGTHSSSCPCLNQDHFYLNPVKDSGVIRTVDFAAGEEPDKGETIYDPEKGTLTVYNGELEKWVVLDATDKVHLYYQFSGNSIELAPYHFKMVDNNFVRISKWDTTDVRKRTNPGIWDHADEEEGCYDRWMEAKSAISEFNRMLLNANSQNNVALVPFSVRDSTMLDNLNGFNRDTNTYYRKWLIQNNDQYHFFNNQVTIGTDDKLSGTYNSKVSWTDQPNDIDHMLPRLFTTGNTDYIYALSSAYNMLTERTQHAKETKRAVVVFLSDGEPYPMSATGYVPGSGSVICSFYNPIANITELRNAITSDKDWVSALPNFWPAISGNYQRHDVNPSYLLRNESNAITGAPGLGAEFVSVSYMLDNPNSTILSGLATDPDLYINITPESSKETPLKDALLNASISPGGRNCVLRDTISKYFYIPDDAVLPDGVTIEGNIEDGQTIVWEIGSLVSYSKQDQPTIRIPLILREQYRNTEEITYFPTNDDNPEPSLYTPDNGPDGPDTGAKLYYTDPYDTLRYDTIGAPKLPVIPVETTTPAVTATASPETTPSELPVLTNSPVVTVGNGETETPRETTATETPANTLTTNTDEIPTPLNITPTPDHDDSGHNPETGDGSLSGFIGIMTVCFVIFFAAGKKSRVKR